MKKHMLRVLSMAIALTMSMTFALSGWRQPHRAGSSTSGEGTTSSTEASTGTEEGASTEETGDTRDSTDHRLLGCCHQLRPHHCLG